jgi:aryl-alcohol dehydrogenase-like predicted oxidoreductase
MPAWLTVKALWLSHKYNLNRFQWIQNSYSLLERDDEREMLPLCADQKLGYTPFSPLAGGFLTGKYKLAADYPDGSRMTMRPEPYAKLWNEHTFAALSQFRNYAEQYSVSMAGLALAWVMNQPQVTAPIIGPRRPAHLQPIQEALGLKLSPNEWQQLADLFPLAA